MTNIVRYVNRVVSRPLPFGEMYAEYTLLPAGEWSSSQEIHKYRMFLLHGSLLNDQNV